MSDSLLDQSVPPVAVVRDEHLGWWAKAKSYYDKTANSDLSPPSPGQDVYTRPNDHNRGGQWGYGEVLEEVTPRSYLVRTQGGLVRRNRTHLWPAKPLLLCASQALNRRAADSSDDSVAIKSSESTDAPPETGAVESPSAVQTSHYGRVIRQPKRLDL